MASFRQLRRDSDRSATAERSCLRGRRPFALLTATVALVAVALLLLAQLAGQPERQGTPSHSAPAFLAKALGAPQASAPLVRKPRPGIRVQLRPTGYEIARDGRRFSLASTEQGTDWRRFRNGARRRTDFGSETVLVDWTKTEQFLTVESRQGRRTWKWRLATDGLKPALRGDGAVGFSARGRDANLSILPPRILDSNGRDVTPANTRWRLARRGGGWLLALDVDDASLPLPYVIDPASNYPTPLNLLNTASAVTGSWRMNGSTGTVDTTTDTVPGNGTTGYFEFNPGASNATAGTPGGATGSGWIVEPAGGAAGFPAGTWTFTVQTDIPNTTFVAGTAILAIGMWKGTIAGSTFTSTGTPLAVTDDPAAQDIRTSTNPVTTNVSYSLPQITLAAGETLYVEIWRKQVNGIASGNASRRTLDLYVNDGVTKIAHPAADDVNPTSSYSLASQAPAGTSFLNGTTIYYRGTGGGSGGNFQIRNTVADGGSGPASSTTMDTLASGGWTHTASSVSTPAGGPYDSNTLTWTEGSSSAPTERAYGSDAAGNGSSTTTFTMTNDSTAPPAPATTFPVSSGAYRSSTWNAGCATNGLCGTAGADAASGLRQVDLSIQRDSSGLYWDGSGFNSTPEVFVTATGTSTWTYTFPASSFPADGMYTVKVRSVDNVNNTATASSFGFTYDTTAPSAPSSLGTTPASPANNNDPRLTGTAEAGSTVDLYATSDCSGGIAATGSAATFGGAGLDPANVADDSSTSYTAKATDAAGNVSGCSTAITYVEDSTAPSAPSGLGTTPASPANDNDPRVTGSAEAGSTVNLYATADCTGGAAATGSAATFGGAGLDPANVADDSSTSYTAKATDAAGNVSGCSTAITYVEDSTAPAAPTIASSSPASPATDNDPELIGSAEAASTVRIYTNGTCTSGVAATGSAATFGGAGLSVNVADDSTTGFYATATDAAGNASGCSVTPLAYVEDSTAPSTPSGLAASPASPANDNDPEISGSAEAASTVRLYTTSDCSGAAAATGTAAAFGGAGLSANVGNDSSSMFKATATDAAGNASACSSGVAYVEDSTAPAAPNTLSSSPGSPANENDPEITGSAEAGSTVRLYTTSDCSGAATATGTAAAFATPGFTINVGNDSSTTFKATATDAAGNASSCSSGYAYVEDSTAPSAPGGLATSPASPANDNDPEIIGSAEAGSTVRLYPTSDCSGAAAATGTAAVFGGAGISVNVANDSSSTFKATATDAAGNGSGCSSGVAYVEDSTAPSAPSGLATSPASPANDNDPEVTGSAEAGSTVRLYTTSDCSGAAAATGTAAAFGGAGLSVNVANDSSTTFKATATDAAGNASSCSSGIAYVEDSTAPGAPTITSSSPPSPADDNDPELLGTAEAGSTVRLYTNASCTSAVAATGTAATFSSPGLTVTVGDNTTTTFYATATDAAGNASGCSSGLTYEEDSTPPAPTGLAPSPASPASDNDPEITGTAQAGSTVKVYTTADCSGAPVATGGAAAFAAPGLTVNVANDSTTTFKATATIGSNTSGCSVGTTYVEDSTAPAAPSALNSSPGSPANDNDPEMTGSAEAASTVRVYTTSDCSGAPVATGGAVAFATPGFTVSVGNDSSTTYTATATDASGNTSACSTGYTYVEDSTAPSAPGGLAVLPASPANDNDPEISGSAEAASTVRIYTTSDCSGAAAASGSAATFGGAGISVNVANDSSSTFKATASDAAGNVSPCSSGVAYVEDSTAPTAPSGLATSPASPANDNDPEITGSAEAASTVRVYTTSDCSGAASATGSAATFGGAGISVNVANDSSTTFKATATDPAGNASPCSGGVAYVEDSTAPAAPSSLGSAPGSPANENDPELTGSAEAGSTVRLYTTSDCSGAPVATGTAAAFAAPGLTVNVGNDSSTSFRATATDAANNLSSCSGAYTYVEDSTAPTTPSGLATSPASPADDNDPELTGSAEAGSTVRLYTTSDCSGAEAATGTAAVFGGAGISVNVANDSSTTFKATATDAAGNASSCSSGTAYVEDSTAPSSTVTFPVAGASYDASGWDDFSGAASDGAGSGLQRVELSIRRVSDGNYWNGASFSSGSEDWRTASGTSSWSYAFAVGNFPADGDYTVRVRAVDNAGNAQSPSSRTFTIDRTAPNTQIDSGPSNPSNDANPSFTFSADEGGATFECRLDGGSWSSCTSPKSYSGLAEASHTFEVRATDGAGNTDPSPASQTWTLDLTDPTSAFSFPAAGGSYNSAGWNDFGGSASDSGGAGLLRVELSVRSVSTGNYWDGSGFGSGTEQWHTASGTSSWTLAFASTNFPADGDYTVRVRAVDNATNTQTPVSRSFTVDTVAPETTIDSGPSGPTASTDANFAFSANQVGSTFECRLDGGSWSSCASPKSYTSLAQGSHTFDVRATDPGNNADASPASRAWTVDTVPPSATMHNPGAYLRGTVTLTSTTSDTGGTGIASVTYERSPAGAGTWSSVSATWDTTTATDGLYDLHVVAVDNAGNTTTSAAVTNVRVDNTPPNVTMNSPGAAVNGTVALSSTNDDGGGSGIDTVQFQVKPTSGSTWTDTSASWDTTAVLDGSYDLRAIVTDRAGNSTTSAAVTTIVDNTNPTISFDAPPDGGFVNAAAADPFTVAATAADTGSGVASVEFWACDNASAGCSSGNWTSLGSDATAPYEASWALPPTDGNQALRARATDQAGRTATVVNDVTIDSVVPDTTLLTNPGDPSNNATPTFSFSSNEVGATFECRVDGGAWTACSTPHTTGTLADGTHTFDVRSTDAAGNLDTTPESWTWLVDTTSPTATMDDPGANLRLSVNLTSSQSDPGGGAASGIASVQYEYSVADADTWVGTATPWDTTFVADGLYDLRVVVTDQAGNVTQSAPVEDRRVDNTAPSTSHDDPGANIRQTVTLVGQADDTGGSGIQQVEFQISPTGAGSWTAISISVAAPYQASFDTTTYADGLYDFRTVALDVAGNQTEGTPVVSRRIDNTAPVAVMNDPGANLRGTVNLTSTADDPGGSGVASVVYEYAQAGGSAWQGISSSWATATVPDGLYDLRVVVRDAAGNETISATVANRLVDNTAPTTTDNAPSGWQSSAVTVSLSASDGSGSGVTNTQYAVDGGAWQSGTSVAISSDGIHTISYFSTDAVGNVESPRTATVMIDTTPPDPGANDPGNYLRGTVTLSANASGSGAPITEVEFQYSPAGAGTWTSIGTDTTGPAPYTIDFDTTSVPDGSYDLRFIVRDEASNENTTDLASRIVDNTPPTGSVGSPLNGAVVSGNVTIGVTANDANPIAQVEFFVRGGSIGTSTMAPFQQGWDSASAGDGPADIYIIVTDMAGNSTTSATITVTADNFAPAVSLSSPGSAIRGTVTLTASADADATQVTFERRPAGSGGGWTAIAADTSAPWSGDFVTTAVADGDYELRATATDAGGNTGASSIVTTKVDNTNPNGSLTQPGGGATVGGSSVPLSATANDGAGGSGVASVTWQYRQTAVGGGYSDAASDGSAPYSATWDVTSLASAAYDVRIVVTDVAGNTFATNPVQVDVDSTAPTVTLNDPGALISGTVALSAVTGGDAQTVAFGISPAGAASWTTIGTDGTAPYGTSFDTTTRNDGLYDLRAVVSDAAGNTSTDVRPGVRIDNFLPVVISSVPANGSLVASASQIVLTVSEDIGSLASVELDGVPAVPPVVSGTTATFNTGALANGPHTLSGTVTDGAGNSSGFSVSFVVGVPAPPPPTPGGFPVDPFPLVPAPTNFRGVIEEDGTLTLAWTPAKDVDGKPLATVLYVDNIATQSFPAGESEVNLGPFDPADMRVFEVAAIDADGEASATSPRLRSTTLLAGKPLADVEAILVNRGFELGEVRGSGTIVVKPAKPLLAALGSKVDVELGQPVAPQTRLVFSVVGTKKFSWSVRKDIGVRTKATRASQVTVSLVSPSGVRVYRWRFRIKAGTSIVRLTMPPQVRRPGKYRLVFTAEAGRDSVKRTITVEIVGKKQGAAANPSKKPIEIVLAGGSNIRKDIALGLADDGMRVFSATGTDDTFGLTGNAARNVQVIVVDVDRYGVGLVRDLRIVFPMVKIIALSNDPRRLAQAMRAGAAIAVPRNTPSKDLAKLIAQVARRR